MCVKLTVLDHHSGTAIKSTKSRLITQQLFKKVTSVLESSVGITYKLQVNKSWHALITADTIYFPIYCYAIADGYISADLSNTLY